MEKKRKKEEGRGIALSSDFHLLRLRRFVPGKEKGPASSNSSSFLPSRERGRGRKSEFCSFCGVRIPEVKRKTEKNLPRFPFRSERKGKRKRSETVSLAVLAT